MLEHATVSYDLLEDGIDFLGTATKITRPDISFLTQEISGSGIAGNIEAVIAGMVQAMTLGIEFRQVTEKAMSLCEPRKHTLTVRAATQGEDEVTGQFVYQGTKDVFRVTPKTFKSGTIATASPHNASGEYAVDSWTQYIDGKKVIEIDPKHVKCTINGYDYMAQLCKALGR